MINFLLKLTDLGLMPDFIIRIGIRQLLKERLEVIRDYNQQDFINELNNSLLAHETEAANEQHYEVPTEYFKLALGNKLKYSSCFYNGSESLNEAEINMLELYKERAELSDGQSILELGCGWGSACLYFAQKFPNSKITGISNSNGQREYINSQIKALGLTNLTIITADINNFKTEEKFDRIISIEMFEHLRNYKKLFAQISSWLKDSGKLFVHIFCHKNKSYLFEAKDDSDWMAKYFFTGGMMPAKDLFYAFNENLEIINQWDVNGTHYSKTSEHWYENHLANKEKILPILKTTYKSEAGIWFNRWKIFYLACAELFGYDKGNEWFVSHYLFKKK